MRDKKKVMLRYIHNLEKRVESSFKDNRILKDT